MSFTCEICKELLLPGTGFSHQESDIIVTTKCGHLFHNSCLSSFFEQKSGVGCDGSPVLSKSFCPVCRRVVLTQNILQILPAENNEDHFGKLFARCNDLIEQNEELKNENEKLKTENEDLRKELGTKSKGTNGVPIPTGLSVEDIVLWFPDVEVVSEENGYNPEAGTVKWIGRINEILHAGIEFNNPIGNDEEIKGGGTKKLFTAKPKYGKLVPVNELILYSDYYTESPATPAQKSNGESKPAKKDKESVKPKHKTQIQKNSEFEKQLNEFISFHDIAAAEYSVLQEEVKRLLSEDIVADPSAIQDQMRRATEIHTELIEKKKLIENLKQLSVVVLQFEDITTQEIYILKEGIESLERLRDTIILNLDKVQFHKALGHSVMIRDFLQSGYDWLNTLESQFGLLSDEYNDEDDDEEFTTQNLLRMKIDFEFRQPQMYQLAIAYNLFQTPGFKLKSHDQIALKSAMDTFEALRNRNGILNSMILHTVNRIFKSLNDWCGEVHFALETEFGSQLLIRLQELAKEEEKLKGEIPKLADLKNALSKDKNNFVEMESLTRNFEALRVKLDATSTELKAEIKQLKSQPAQPKAYY